MSFSPKSYVLLRESEPKLPITSVNVDTVRIKIFRITDRGLNEIGNNDYSGFLKQIWEYNLDDIQKKYGEIVYQGEMDLGGEKNKTTVKQIPFSTIVQNPKPGVYLVYAEEKNSLFGDKATASQWLIISDLGLTTFTESGGGIAVNVRSIKTGEALSGVELQLLARNNSILGVVKTDSDGMGYFDASIARGKDGMSPLWVLAYGKKEDFSLLDLDMPAFDLSDRGVQGRKAPGPLDAYLYTEQGVYRPLETVHVNTLLRDDKANAKGGLPLTFRVLRPDEVEVQRVTLTGNDLGFYELALPLSGSARTGQWTVLAYADVKKDAIGRATFAVEDFVPSRILIQMKSDKPFLALNQTTNIDVIAKYLFGAKAAGLSGTAVMTQKVSQTPYPKYADFAFGIENEIFRDARIQLPFSSLDNEGKTTIPVNLEKAPETTKPLEAQIKVTLADKGGRPEIGTLKLPIYTKPFMIGIKPNFSDRVVPSEATDASFDIITVNQEGFLNAVEQLEYEFYKQEAYYTWYQSASGNPWSYQTQYEDKFIVKGTLNTKSEGPATLSLPIAEYGPYRLDIRDPKTGAATSVQFSKGWLQISKGGDTPDRLKIKIDKEKVKPGDKVTVMIEAPFEGTALLTIANSTILENRMVDVSTKGSKIKLEASKDWGTGVYCLVSAVRPLDNANSQKSFLPKRAVGIAWIAIDPALRGFSIDIKPEAEVRPNQTIQVPIQVKNKDGSGTPSQAEITVAAVDEGILKLTDFKTPNPLNYFLGQQQLGIMMRDLYGKLIDPLEGPLGTLRSGGDAGMLSRNMQALSKRSFKIVSLYKGLVPLDKQGKATVPLELPDFNGSLRIMAVAFDDKRVGSQEASLLVRDPIVVEGILPRFLAPQDNSVMSVSLYNVAMDTGKYILTINSTGDVEVKGQKQYEVELEKGGSRNFSIPIEAARIGSGKITLELKGKDGKVKDKEGKEQDLTITRNFDISIRSPIANVHQTQNQWLKPGDSVTLNKELIANFMPGTVEAFISWSSILPWDIQAIYRSLKQYPFGCVEQVTSRAIASLLNGNKEDQRVVNQALAVLAEKQNADGSFALWTSLVNERDPWLTAYVVDFLLRAKARGYDVPYFTLENGLNWLSNYVRSNGNTEKEATLINLSYALYILAKTDRIEAGSIRYFYDSFFNKLSNPLARALVANSLVVKGDMMRAEQAFQGIFSMKEALAAKKETAGTTGTGGTIDTAKTVPYGTRISEEAFILLLLQESLIENPSLPVASQIESLKQDLGTRLKADQHLSTQEQAWILMASYALVGTSSSFPWTVMVDNSEFKGNNGFLSLPLNNKLTHLERGGIAVQNPSNQVLWQSIDVSGIPKEVQPESNGFEIERHYYNLQGEEVILEHDAERNTGITQGTEFIVVVSGRSLNKLPHQILIQDMLPAGFELENSNLANSSQFNWLGNLTHASHTELRDDRYLAFLNQHADQSEFRFAYQVRAVTPGNYDHPGLYVEDMYAPQFRARTVGDRVQVVAQP